MGKIFISYSSKNQKIANDLCRYLEQQGIRCWIAPRDIPSASNYAGEITRAIKSADRFLLLYSKDAGKSEHVKNEINLAINNSKQILPYCLDNSPYDDDLEYYLSTKQRIASSGDQQQDFESIATILLGHPVSAPVATPEPAPVRKEKPAAKKPNRMGLYVGLGALVVAALLVWLFFLRPKPEGPDIPVVPIDSLAVDTTGKTPDIHKDTTKTVNPPVVVDTNKDGSKKDETKKDETKKDETKKEEPKKDTSADTFTGTIKNGYPDGYGTYTFKKSRRIDMHDPEARVAQAGDYIVGDWNNGHLNYGEWYGANGVKKAFIELGDNSDVQFDHTFAKCVKP